MDGFTQRAGQLVARGIEQGRVEVVGEEVDVLRWAVDHAVLADSTGTLPEKSSTKPRRRDAP